MFSICSNVVLHIPLNRNYLDQFSGKDLISVAILKYYLDVTVLEHQEHSITISSEILMYIQLKRISSLKKQQCLHFFKNPI